MEQIRKLPIGIQTFDKLREGGFLYVDKTAMIYQIASTSTPYFLSRPRRFGKSLLISTFEAYFQGRKDLFQGLAIEQLETKWEQYPVLHLDLNARKYETAADLTPSKEAEARQLLKELIRDSGRDPQYTCDKSGQALLDEIKFYRRIELWGEGFSWFDFKRRKDTIVRHTFEDGGNYMTNAAVTIDPEIGRAHV